MHQLIVLATIFGSIILLLIGIARATHDSTNR
ncbi:MAG: hypothetical protein QOD56_3283 [Gammaproteobacteria bacterium]|jgi:hypothetical protein|nr:hypothetical protein [Gammaproteobacteria bacterium]